MADRSALESGVEEAWKAGIGAAKLVSTDGASLVDSTAKGAYNGALSTAGTMLAAVGGGALVDWANTAAPKALAYLAQAQVAGYHFPDLSGFVPNLADGLEGLHDLSNGYVSAKSYAALAGGLAALGLVAKKVGDGFYGR